MKTTLVIDDSVMMALKAEAARRRTTMSELVESALRALLRPSARAAEIPPLPAWRGGAALVDISNREVLAEVLDPVDEVRLPYQVREEGAWGRKRKAATKKAGASRARR